MELINLVNCPGWHWALKQNIAIINAPSERAALILLENSFDKLAITAAKIKGQVLVKWLGCDEPFKITAEMANIPNEPRETAKKNLESSESELIIPELEIDLNSIYNNPLPVYINQLSDQKVLFANPAALKAQGKKPAEFLGESAAALNEPEELEYRDSLIIKDSFLNEYRYNALRWYKEPETHLWRRKRMEFYSNFRKINYLGEPCRLAVVLEAVETGKTVGS